MASIQHQQQQQAILTKKLEVLLGFEDGAADVLEHLLTIESNADLLDYLTQLLGADREEQLRAFVDDVGRVQRGESLMMPQDAAANKLEEKIQKTPPVLVTLTKKPPAQKTAPTKAKAAPTPVPPPLKTVTPPAAAAAVATPPKLSNRNKKIVTAQLSLKEEIVEPIKKSQPPKGKPAIECGCYGSLHKALTNCLFCGRISCEREGYDYCPFCGFLVEEVQAVVPAGDGDATAKDEAWKHKERLLRYDREFAQRTIILDDQADYYSSTTSAWLTDDEQVEAAKQEQQRQDDIHKRKKMQLNLGL